MSDFSFAMHHLLTRKFFDSFGDDMDTLFGGRHGNPDRPDAICDAMALANG